MIIMLHTRFTVNTFIMMMTYRREEKKLTQLYKKDLTMNTCAQSTHLFLLSERLIRLNCYINRRTKTHTLKYCLRFMLCTHIYSVQVSFQQRQSCLSFINYIKGLSLFIILYTSCFHTYFFSRSIERMYTDSSFTFTCLSLSPSFSFIL